MYDIIALVCEKEKAAEEFEREIKKDPRDISSARTGWRSREVFRLHGNPEGEQIIDEGNQVS